MWSLFETIINDVYAYARHGRWRKVDPSKETLGIPGMKRRRKTGPISSSHLYLLFAPHVPLAGESWAASLGPLSPRGLYEAELAKVKGPVDHTGLERLQDGPWVAISEI